MEESRQTSHLSPIATPPRLVAIRFLVVGIMAVDLVLLAIWSVAIGLVWGLKAAGRYGLAIRPAAWHGLAVINGYTSSVGPTGGNMTLAYSRIPAFGACLADLGAALNLLPLEARLHGVAGSLAHRHLLALAAAVSTGLPAIRAAELGAIQRAHHYEPQQITSGRN